MQHKFYNDNFGCRIFGSFAKWVTQLHMLSMDGVSSMCTNTYAYSCMKLHSYLVWLLAINTYVAMYIGKYSIITYLCVCVCQVRVHTTETSKMCETHVCLCKPQCTWQKSYLMCTYMYSFDVPFTSSIFHVHGGYIVSIFGTMLSYVVASHICSQV